MHADTITQRVDQVNRGGQPNDLAYYATWCAGHRQGAAWTPYSGQSYEQVEEQAQLATLTWQIVEFCFVNRRGERHCIWRIDQHYLPSQIAWCHENPMDWDPAEIKAFIPKRGRKPRLQLVKE